jgi:hypothetical protein
MIKVKFFREDTQFNLEIEVNEFIADKNVINISYAIEQCGYDYIYSCCIFYKD